MRNISPFKAKLTASPLPTKWLSFYVAILLPLIAVLFSLAAIVTFYMQVTGSYYVVSAIVVYASFAALFWLAFIEIKNLSKRGFVLNQIAVCLTGIFVPLYFLGYFNFVLENQGIYFGVAFGALWIITNLIYFAKRKPLFDSSLGNTAAVEPESESRITTRKDFSQELLKSRMHNGWLRFYVLWRLPVTILYALGSIGLTYFSIIRGMSKHGFTLSFYSRMLFFSAIEIAFLALMCLAYVYMIRLSAKGYRLAVALSIVEAVYDLVGIPFGYSISLFGFYNFRTTFFLGGLVLLIINLPYLEKRRHLFVHTTGKNSSVPRGEPAEKAVEEIV